MTFDLNNERLAEVYAGRGYAYFQLEDYQKSLADLNEALRLNPKLVEAYVHRSYIYSQSESTYQQALDDANQAIAINPNYAEAYVTRSLIFMELKETQKARADLEKAAELFKQQNNPEMYQRTIEILKLF